MSILFFLFGFFSLWLVPGYYRLNLPYVFFILLWFFSFGLILKNKFLNDYFLFMRKYLRVFILAFLYGAASIFAALRFANFSGIFPVFVVLSVFLFWSFVFFLKEKGFSLQIENYLRGFWYGALFISLYIMAEAYFYYTQYMALNELLFPDYLLQAARGHTYFNEDYSYLSLFHRPLFRPAGLSWDPGLTLPALVLVLIFGIENVIFFPMRKIGLWLIFLGILISTSKTALGGFFIYLFAKLCFWIFGFFKNSIREKLEKISPLVGFLAFILVGIPFFFVEDFHSGFIHIRYLASLVFLYKANFIEFMFGFGYRNTNYFFHKYVPWVQNVADFPVTGLADVESLLTNIFLWGGFVGSLFWIFTYVKSYQFALKKERLILLTLIALAFGYNFHTLWFLVFYFYLFWSILIK